MSAVVTNRHKKDELAAWLAAHSTVKVLLLKVAPAGCFDPDLDTVAQLLAVSTAAECDFTNYARKTLASVTATEVDGSDWAALDAANVVWTSAGGATNNTPAAAAYYDEGGGTDATRILVGVTSTGFGSTTTNGGDLTYAIPDFLHAV